MGDSDIKLDQFEKSDTLSGRVDRVIRNSILLYAMNVIVMAFMGVVIIRQERLSSETSSVEAAQRIACESTEDLKAIIRDDRVDRVHDSERFLRANPNGIPGIRRALMEDGIKESYLSIGRLDPRKC